MTWLDAVAQRAGVGGDPSLHERDRRHLLRLVRQLEAALRDATDALATAADKQMPDQFYEVHLRRANDALAACEAETPPTEGT